jgi:hypothetical protein
MRDKKFKRFRLLYFTLQLQQRSCVPLAEAMLYNFFQ